MPERFLADKERRLTRARSSGLPTGLRFLLREEGASRGCYFCNLGALRLRPRHEGFQRSIL